MNYDAHTIGEAIRTSRIQQKLSQEDVAERVGLSAAYIKHIESGRRKPSLPSFFKIVAALNMSMDFLIYPRPTDAREELIEKITNQLVFCDEKELKILSKLLFVLQEKE